MPPLLNLTILGASKIILFNTIYKNIEMKNIVIIFTLFLASCGSQKTEETALTTERNTLTLSDAQYKNAEITTGKLQQEPISSVLKTNGQIEAPPQNTVSISVPMGGYLTYTRLIPGMQVRKGQVLAVVEDPQYIQLQQDYLTAKAQITFDESEFTRQKELNQEKAVSDKAFEQARVNYQTRQVLIRALEEKLKLIGLNPQKVSASNISKSINVYSPISGFVTAVDANIGKYVNPSDVLFELVNPSDIHLKLIVFEKDINKLSVGQKLLAYSNTNPDIKYPCEIILISKSLTEDRAVEVHCHFDKYDKDLLPGMFMNADIEIKSVSTSVLPEEAIVQFESKQYVFIEDADKKFKMLEVETGNSENGFTELKNIENLKDANFVKTGAYNLLMALKNTADE